MQGHAKPALQRGLAPDRAYCFFELVESLELELDGLLLVPELELGELAEPEPEPEELLDVSLEELDGVLLELDGVLLDELELGLEDDPELGVEADPDIEEDEDGLDPELDGVLLEPDEDEDGLDDDGLDGEVEL